MKKHIHCDLIKQWADGAEIEVFNSTGGRWVGFVNKSPSWDEMLTYRIKPKYEDGWYLCRREDSELLRAKYLSNGKLHWALIGGENPVRGDQIESYEIICKLEEVK